MMKIVDGVDAVVLFGKSRIATAWTGCTQTPSSRPLLRDDNRPEYS